MEWFTQEVADVKQKLDTLQSVAQQTASDLQNQVDTANLQHQNDLESIALLNAGLTADTRTIANLQAQLAAQPVVYDRLESKPFRSNLDKSVGGNGLGNGGWKAPGIECAELWILDQAGQPTPAYVDCYNTQDFPADATKTHFRLEGSYMFPAAADLAACQCLEWEARQVFQGHMFIFAGQLQYSGGNLRYFDDIQKWTATGTKITKPAPLQWVRVAIEGHRDPQGNAITDVLELDGTKTPLNLKYVAQPTTWHEGLLRVGLQLDDNAAVNGYRVKIDDWQLTVW